MNRRDFLKRCAAWAALAPLAPALLTACGDDTMEPLGLYRDLDVNFDGDVLIIGAGAAGLAAGYLLSRYGIAYHVLEASDRFGGRVLHDDGFADFPIDLGAEWIHTDPSVLASLIDDPNVRGSIDVVPFSPESISTWDGDRLRPQNWTRNYYQEYKFKNTTWFSFLERHIAPDVLPNLRLEHPVDTIDTTGARVVVTTQGGARFEADRVIVTAPIAVLQSGMITLVPELTDAAIGALDRVHIPHGIKVFTEFERRFYPDLVLNGGLLDEASSAKLYYDATFRKNTARHVMGLFWVEDAAARFTELGDDRAVVAAMVDELDAMFGGNASRYHVQSVVQNWSAAPYTLGAYPVEYDALETLFDALNGHSSGRLFFAGAAFAEETSTVHGAMRSGYDAVVTILRG